MKVCTKCGEWKSLEAFHNCSNRADGLQAKCKKCRHIEDLEYRRQRQQKNPPEVCKYCGRIYRPKEEDRTTFCSQKCAFAWKHERAAKRVEDRAAGIGSACRVYFGQCVECGRLFTKQHFQQKRCSRKCRLAYGSRRFREYKKGIGRHSGRVIRVQCKECGKEFEQRVHNRIKDFCSKKCARKNWRRLNPEKDAAMKAKQRHVRRARKNGGNGTPAELIIPRKVYERDGWRCGICGEKVDRKLRFPHLMSACLDHIQPLAGGGTHTLGNVQLAHFICNSHKGANGGGQLRLGLSPNISVYQGASTSVG